MSIEIHTKEIERVYNHLIDMGNFLDDTSLKEYKNYLDDKHKQYISSFKEIFQPNKTIKKDMEYFADIRTLSKYNENIITGWLVEDFFIYLFDLPIFKKHNFYFKISNHDSDRIIKKERTFIDSNPDFNITHNNTNFKVEIQALLIPYKKFHIKQNKANRLFNLNSFLYCLLLSKKQIIFFNKNDINRYGRLTNITAFGGKKGFEFIIENLPKNKIIDNKILDKKILITLYWFYIYKRYDEKEFYKIQKELLYNSKNIDILLNTLLEKY